MVLDRTQREALFGRVKDEEYDLYDDGPEDLVGGRALPSRVGAQRGRGDRRLAAYAGADMERAQGLGADTLPLCGDASDYDDELDYERDAGSALPGRIGPRSRARGRRLPGAALEDGGKLRHGCAGEFADEYEEDDEYADAMVAGAAMPGRVGARSRSGGRRLPGAALDDGGKIVRSNAYEFTDDFELEDEAHHAGSSMPGRVGARSRLGGRRIAGGAPEPSKLSRGRSIVSFEAGDDKDIARNAGASKPARLKGKVRPPKFIGASNLFQSTMEHSDGTTGGPVHHLVEDDAAAGAPAVCAAVSVSDAAADSPWALSRQQSQHASGGEGLRGGATKLVLTHRELAAASESQRSALTKLGLLNRDGSATPSNPTAPPMLRSVGSSRLLAEGARLTPARAPTSVVGKVVAGLYAVTLAPFARLLGFGGGKKRYSEPPKIERTFDIEETADGEIVVEIDAIDKRTGELQAVRITLDAEQERQLFGLPSPYEEEAVGSDDDGTSAHAGRAKPARVKGRGVGRGAKFISATTTDPKELKIGARSPGVQAGPLVDEEAAGEQSSFSMNAGRAKPARAKPRGGRALVSPAKAEKTPWRAQGEDAFVHNERQSTDDRHAGRSTPTRINARRSDGKRRLGFLPITPGGAAALTPLRSKAAAFNAGGAFKNFEVVSDLGGDAGVGVKRGKSKKDLPNLLTAAVHHPDGTTGGPLHHVERAQHLAMTFGFDEAGSLPKDRAVNRARMSIVQRRCAASAAAGMANEEADSLLEKARRKHLSTKAGRWDALRQHAAMAKHRISAEQLQSLSTAELRAVHGLGIISEWALEHLLSRRRGLGQASPQQGHTQPSPQRRGLGQASPSPGARLVGSPASSSKSRTVRTSPVKPLASRLPEPTAVQVPAAAPVGSGGSSRVPASAGSPSSRASPLDVHIRV